MLRNFVGDSAFWKSLNLYLNTYKFKSAEAENLRLSFEDVTGKDLTWFWNQWYYASGHPKFDIAYSYDTTTKNARVIVKQTQAGNFSFKLPVAIDVYSNGKKNRYKAWVENNIDTFYFAAETRPDLINFDGEKVLLAEKKENKNLENYIYQYKYAKKYVDRREAVDYAIKYKHEANAKAFLREALGDPFHELRGRVLRSLKSSDLDSSALLAVELIARKDEKRANRAAAIDILASVNNPRYTDLFIAGVKDSSYSVAGASLIALAGVNEKKAISLVPDLKNDAKGRLAQALPEVEVLMKGDIQFDEMTNNFDKLNNLEKAMEYRTYLNYLGNVNNTANFKKGIDQITVLRDAMALYDLAFKTEVDEQLEHIKRKKLALKTSDNEGAINEQIGYIEKKTR
jgi:aminopeptidase N